MQLRTLLKLDYWCSNPQHKILQVTESNVAQIFVDIFSMQTRITEALSQN